MPPRQSKTKAVKPKAESTEVLDHTPPRIPRNIFIGAPFGKISQRIDSDRSLLTIDSHRIVLKSAYNSWVREIPQPWRQMTRALRVHNWKENVSSKLVYEASKNDIPSKAFKWTSDQKSTSINNLRNLALNLKGPSRDDSLTPSILQDLVTVISRKFTKLTSLSLTLDLLGDITIKGFEEIMILIVKQLPNLVWLNIRIQYCWKISDKSISITTCKAGRYLRKLRGLAIFFDSWEKKSDGVQILHPRLANLNYLFLHYDWNFILEDFQNFSLKSFNKLSALNRLSLSLPRYCNEIASENYSRLGSIIGKVFDNLRHLSLHLPKYPIKNQHLQTALSGIAENIPLLTGLSLLFSNCDQITTKEIKRILAQISELFPKLRELHLKFSEYRVTFEEIRSYKAKIKKCLPLLEKLSINF